MAKKKRFFNVETGKHEVDKSVPSPGMKETVDKILRSIGGGAGGKGIPKIEDALKRSGVSEVDNMKKRQDKLAGMTRRKA